MRTQIEPRVRTRRIYEAPSADDGYRVLATRYWPRGVKKESVDEYVSALAPSRGLLQSYRTEDITWEEFRKRYLDEMRGEDQRTEIYRLANLARSQKITLLCICNELEKCHRWLLRDLVLRLDVDP